MFFNPYVNNDIQCWLKNATKTKILEQLWLMRVQLDVNHQQFDTFSPWFSSRGRWNQKWVWLQKKASKCPKKVDPHLFSCYALHQKMILHISTLIAGWDDFWDFFLSHHLFSKWWDIFFSFTRLFLSLLKIVNFFMIAD